MSNLDAGKYDFYVCQDSFRGRCVILSFIAKTCQKVEASLTVEESQKQYAVIEIMDCQISTVKDIKIIYTKNSQKYFLEGESMEEMIFSLLPWGE
ncbi:hypothetical protein HON22_05930 [Candidatus Peregrinibacteria bacterium]|jgi:hypothetical protein|nr:hypothetical protein [Candidatus Peregrinibacteria bacterium]